MPINNYLYDLLTVVEEMDVFKINDDDDDLVLGVDTEELLL